MTRLLRTTIHSTFTENKSEKPFIRVRKHTVESRFIFHLGNVLIGSWFMNLEMEIGVSKCFDDALLKKPLCGFPIDLHYLILRTACSFCTVIGLFKCVND